jgi:hypothetical protein
MDGSRFDRVSKLFAERRLSRRRAVTQGGTAVAAGALAVAGLKAAASAQDATPEAAEGGKVEFLFVQSFQQGNIVPKEGEDGTYSLTLEQGLGQTIYFSDRPERIVGASPTAEFLKGLGFSADNPPNAALLVEAAPGETDIAVLELFNPRYDEPTHTAKYDVQFLEHYEQALGMSFTEQPADLAQLHPQFGAAHLFIDDCADYGVSCCSQYNNYTEECENPYVGSFPSMGYCYSSEYWHCFPCEPYGHDIPEGKVNPIYGYWSNKCNATYGACNGICQAFFWT